MRSSDELKTLLLRHFMLVMIVGVLGSTMLIHTPRVAQLQRASREHIQALQGLKDPQLKEPEPAQQAVWQEEVPLNGLQEGAAFTGAMRALALEADCVLKECSPGEPEPVQEQEELVALEGTVVLDGTYDQLLTFVNLLREQQRLLTVSRVIVKPADYPKLSATLGVRRYIRQPLAAPAG
ncbi:MAG: hypothetical protein ACK47B_24635 [Armatimonadota bacterium]